MLYWLLYQQLYPAVGPFRVFGYVTSRTLFASLTSLFLCILLGPWLIRKLREFQIGQHIREDGPKSHQKKAGTPTMGGVLIVISILVPTLLWADLRHLYPWIAIFALLAFGYIGFIDDYSKVMNKRNLGLTAKQKFALQMAVAAVITGVLAIMQYYGVYTTTLNVPFLKQIHPDLLIHSLMGNPITYAFGFTLFYFFVVLVVVGSSNAVNITDGLDGLAIGLMVISAGALTILAYTSGNRELAHYLQLHDGRESRFPLVECTPGGHFHGRCRFPFAWWGDGRGRGHDQAGNPADLHRGHVCRGTHERHPASGELQTAQEANLQNGAHSSPFRGARMAGIENHCAFLDCGAGHGFICPHHPQTEMTLR
jgi:phospho-N-acetylmuramoyl-pentapeptide-transferase